MEEERGKTSTFVILEPSEEAQLDAPQEGHKVVLHDFRKKSAHEDDEL